MLKITSTATSMMMLYLLFFAEGVLGQSIDNSGNQNLLKIADEFITSAELLLDQDIIVSLEAAEEAITDEATKENMDRIFLVTEYQFSLENKEKLQSYSDKLQEIAIKRNKPSFVLIAKIFSTYCVGLDGRYETAMRELEKYLEQALELNDNIAAIIAYHALMGLAPLEGEYYSALIYAEKAGILLDNTEHEDQLRLHHYNSLAYLYTELADLNNALYAANESLRIVRNSGLHTDISTLIYNIGIVLQDKKFYEMSERYLGILANFYNRSGQENMNLYSYYGLALIYYDLEQPIISLEYVYKALEHEDTDKSFAISALQLGAELLADQGELEKAILYRKKIRDYFDEHPEFKGNQWENLNLRVDAKIAYAEKRFEDAFQLYTEFSKVSYNEFERSTSNDIMNIRSDFEATLRLENMSRELLLKNKESQLQQMIFITVGFSFILALVVILLIIQRRTSIKLDKSRLDAEAANQSKSEFLANMSHEMRTPLNAVIGFAEALELGVGAEDKNKRNETLKIIADSGRMLNNLISDILDFSKIEAGKIEFNPEPVSPSEVFEKNLPIIREESTKKNIIFQGIKRSNKKVFVDKNRLDQILLNFITNAIKYNKPNGKLEFGCYDSENGMLRIYVKDTGIGIPEEKENLIFTPFDRVDPSEIASPGIGLGLSICKKLTEAMGGIIGYDTILGEGTTFWVEFPAIKTEI